MVRIYPDQAPNPPSFLLETRFFHAHNLQETLCTESLVPLLGLMPCKGQAGWGTIIEMQKLLRSEYYGFHLHFHRGCRYADLGLQC